MSKFSFEAVGKRLNKKSVKQVEESKRQENLLVFQDVGQPDKKMQTICKDAINFYDMCRKNNRYYSYNLQTDKGVSKPQSLTFRIEEIQKLSHFHMPYIPLKIETQKSSASKYQRQKQLALQIKFRYNIKLIIRKMKKMKISIEQIISRQLFSKQPYKFGKQLILVTKQGNSEKVWRILMENKFCIFSVDNSQKSALIWACIRGHDRILKMLIDCGIDINKKDVTGLNSLNYAIKYNHAQCVRILMMNLAAQDQSHELDCQGADEKVRNVFRVAFNLRKSLAELDIHKRNILFEEQFNYFYK